ncbi:phenylalanine--tRNA ligase subunit beta [Natronomonas sp. EA1]|uniref:phenylalanine--tRNA ligase subunit beta n=1 Tax=Natronomonas sp. EA1 TaxID=3421655 RepID=UPI003EB9519F
MPVVDVDPEELRSLTGHDEKSDEELKEDLFALGLEFEGETEEGDFQLEFAPDRLDRLSVEGVARSLRYQYGDDRGVYVPPTNDAEWTIQVEDVPESRPYVTGAIVRGVEMNEGKLESLIQLQEKLHATMGRKRAKGAIGVHDLTMLKGRATDDDTPKSVTYTGIAPDAERFVPLDSNEEMTPADVLERHDTGAKYADLVADDERYPAIFDDIGLFSFPPVINGSRTEVDEGSRDLFIELTGTDQWTIDKMCTIICYALAARGGKVEEVRVEYPGHELVRPDLTVEEKTVSHSRIESVLGIDLDGTEVVDLFERAGLDATAEDPDADDLVYEVSVPPYRVDVLHALDLVDDVGRAYGFANLEPRYPDVSTVGGRHDRSRLERAARSTLVGLGFEDLLNFHMTAERENYARMNLEEGAEYLGASEGVKITEPYSEDYTMLRTWALPSLMMVLENNTHRSYPQDIAEIGFAAVRDDTESTHVGERRTVAGALARTEASYEDAKARLQTVATAFGKELETPPTAHPSFIPGRVAEVVLDGESVGVVGEIHPKVLVEHDLELPVAAFEFDLAGLE